MASSSASDSNWFHGGLTRSESMALLANQPDGTFLVRTSSRTGCYALDLVTNEGKFLPLLIETVPSGVRLHEEPTLEIKGHEYATLADLVAQNSTWLMYPFLAVPAGEPYNPMAVGNSRSVRAADAARGCALGSARPWRCRVCPRRMGSAPCRGIPSSILSSIPDHAPGPAEPRTR